MGLIRGRIFETVLERPDSGLRCSLPWCRICFEALGQGCTQV